ncbi:MAG: epoxyqueuosine reductase QueH [Armatimonadetes bacterium]|nr:epoxyqueuosine reductase QueH [Armatimonadota bacterium]
MQPEGDQEIIALHICCGPCATAALERLSGRFRVLACWYNPNIWPPDEYQRRLSTARYLCDYFGAALHVGPSDFDTWREAVRGLEEEPEGGRRCEMCISLRLRYAAGWARTQGAQWLSTTLTVGPQKRVETIHQLGRQIAHAAGMQWLEETFRKRGGFQRSVELSRELGLYRQDYCGCIFSQRRSKR